MGMYTKEEFVKVSACTAALISEWLDDYAKTLAEKDLDDGLLDQVSHISDWLSDAAKKVEKKSKR